MSSLAKYNPTDACLITDFLRSKVEGKPLPLGRIEECDLYSQEPWRIFNTTLELKQTFYVFTTLTKIGSRASRTAGSGTWKGQHPTKIFNDGGDFLGYKKSFKFQEGGGPSATSGRWIMKEFSTCDERCNYVLCKIEYFRDEKSKDKEIVTLDDVPVQFEDNNRQAKRARLLHNSGDRTSICDFAVALPSATVDGVQPARSVAPGPDIGNLTSPAFGDTGDTTYPAFDNGPYADLLPLTVEDYTNYPYADLLPLTVEDDTNYLFEVDANYLFGSNHFANPLEDDANYLFGSNPFANPLEDDTTAMLASTLGTLDNQTNTLGTPDNQTWGRTSLHQQRSVAESQEQEVSLEWPDQFFLADAKENS